MLREKYEASKIIKEFARFAHQYDTYNVIQAEVAKALVDRLPIQKYASILDIGCGSGEVYKNVLKKEIQFETFIALDASKEMLDLHPTEAKIRKYTADFNETKTYDKVEILADEALLLSSSSLQWSKDLDFVFSQLSKKSSKAYFAIFTANTFKTLHQTAELRSPIYSEKVLKEVIQKYYQASFETQVYRLAFKTVRDMFNYIKKSGVSGGEQQLSYKQIKQLMRSYPLDYLEFEVLFVEATSLV